MAEYRLHPGTPFRSDDEEQQFYSRTYPDGYRHDQWPDHVERVKASADLIDRYRSRFRTAADLSCGDGALLNMISRHLDTAYFGDLNRPPVSALVSCQAGEYRDLSPQPLPDSLYQLPADTPVGLFILSETLEHVPEPGRLLSEIAEWAEYLFLSTPLSEPVGSGNREHYWGWSDTDIHDLLMENGWHPLEKRLLVPESTRALPDAYTYQLWMAAAV